MPAGRMRAGQAGAGEAGRARQDIMVRQPSGGGAGYNPRADRFGFRSPSGPTLADSPPCTAQGLRMTVTSLTRPGPATALGCAAARTGSPATGRCCWRPPSRPAGGAGRVALLLPPRDRFGLGPPPAGGWRRRILQDAAASGGGTLFALGRRRQRCCSAPRPPRRCARRRRWPSLTAGTPGRRRSGLPRDADAVLAWAAGPTARRPCRCPAAGPAGPAGLHPALDAVPAAGAAGRSRWSRRAGRDAAAAGCGCPAPRSPRSSARWRPTPTCWRMPRTGWRQAAARAGAWARDLPGLAAGAAAARPLPALPRMRPAARPAGAGPAGVLPLAAAADPGFADLRRPLAERGWGLALEGLDAASLGLLDRGTCPPTCCCCAGRRPWQRRPGGGLGGDPTRPGWC